ncbi:MAG: UDP-glucose 4-epimerase [Acidimicrobiia bacterium]
MKAVVTGGAGFIGSNLVDRLVSNGWDVLVVDNLSTGKESNLESALASGRCRLERADILDLDLHRLMTDFGCEVVFHLAAQADVRVSVRDPLADARTNILGTIACLDAATKAGCRRFVFASSGGTIYGEPEEIPVTESHPQVPLSPYGIAKKAGHDYLYYYSKVQKLSGVSLALANVYGPRQDPFGEAGVVAILGGVMLADEQATLYGDGTQTRDFVYVDDVVDAFILAIDHGEAEVLNIGTGKQTRILDLFAEIARLTDYDKEPYFAPKRTGELMHIALDPSRAKEVLGWAPATSLTAGLAKTIEWLRSR